MKITTKHIAIIVGSVVGLGIIAFFVFAFYFASLFPDDVKLDKHLATDICEDFSEYRKIVSMDDATRCVKKLNSIRIDLDDFSNSDSSCNTKASDFEKVLIQFDISKKIYLDFRKRLEQTKLRSYINHEGIQIFIVDGFLDDIWGYLYCDNPSLVTNEDFIYLSNGYSIKIKKDLGDNWYSFSGG